MKGIVTWIGVRDLKSKNIIPTSEVNAIKGKGLEGDKIFLKSSQKRQVTLIMSENINRLKKNHCSLLGNDKLHYVENYLKRNIITQYIALESLIGINFKIGSAIFIGTGNCKPCKKIISYFGKAFFNDMCDKGGITANVVETGLISINSKIEVINNE